MAQDENKKENKEEQVKDTPAEEVKTNEVVEDVEGKKEDATSKDESIEEKEKVEDESLEVSEDVGEEDDSEKDTVSDNSEESEKAEDEVVAEGEKPSDNALPDFKVGDTVRVSYKIVEGGKVRTQPFQGIVIAMKGAGSSKTFTVRKIGADNVGVERIFPFQSPNIDKIKLMKRGKVRRAKLYYLRERVGRKATRIKEKAEAR